MPDYKSMYYHLAGRMATAVDVLETTTTVLSGTTRALEATTSALEDTTRSLIEIKEKLKLSQQATEEIFMSGGEGETQGE